MDFKNQLRKQFNFVITSCKTYDSGLRDEAIRIAVAARVLFHDTTASHSLVKSHLQADRLKMRSTCSDLRKPNPHFLGFIGMEPAIGQFRPYLDEVVRDEQVDLETWWQSEPILTIFKNNEMVTRSKLVLAAANKDGGAHVDATLPSEYERLAKGIGISLVVRLQSGVNQTISPQFANLAALRQIGHEILTSKELIALAI